MGYNNLLERLEDYSGRAKAGSKFMVLFDKYYKASSFFLKRVFKDPNPCMIRSLVLFDLCKKNNIKARLKTGIRKDNGSLEGHSWIEINNMPVNENKKYIESFTVIYEV